MTCSIFIASITSSGWPTCTSSPALMLTLTTVPWIGATTAPSASTADSVVSRDTVDDLPCTSTASGSLESTTAPARVASEGVPDSTAFARSTRSATFLSTKSVVATPSAHVRVREHCLEEAGVGLDPDHAELAQRSPGAIDRVRHVLGGCVPDHLGEQRVEGGVGLVAGGRVRVGAHSRARGGLEDPEHTARRAHGAVGRDRLEVDARLHGEPVHRGPWTGGSPPSPSSASDSPAASRSWACTRSTPVTSSVTVCSTCSRAFASMNQYCSPPLTRNSKVAAFCRPASRAMRRAPSASCVAALRGRGEGRARSR